MLPSACSFIVDGWQEKASRQKHAHKNQKTNENTTENTNENVQGNKSSEADSFRNIKVKHHTHLEMAM
jgi:hypothetical protein